MEPLIRTERISDLLYRHAKPVLEIMIDYPVIGGNIPMRAERVFNSFFSARAAELNDYAHKTFYREASRTLDKSLSCGYSFDFFSCTQSLMVTICEKSYVSLYLDRNLMTGKGRGIVRRDAFTFSPKSGRFLLPAEILGRMNCQTICDTIADMIDRSDDRDTYPDNAREAVRRYFNAKNIFLTPDGIGIFFPVATISPFDCGIRTFMIDKSVYD